MQSLRFFQQHAKVDLFVAQKRERVAVIHDLRAEDGEQLGLEVFFPEMLLLLGQVVEIHLMVAVLCQIFQRFCVEFIALLLQLRRFGHNGGQLLGGGHVGLVFPLFLFGLALLKVCALLQGAHAHHEKLVQIGAGYNDYREKRQRAQELQTVRRNIDQILRGAPSQQKKREQER